MPKAEYWTAPVAYEGPKLSVETGVLIRPAQARKLAETLKQNGFSEDQLRELHSDLKALSNTATEDMKNAFNKKYEKVFGNKYNDNPTSFQVLGTVGLQGCGGLAKDSKFWSVASTNTPSPSQ